MWAMESLPEWEGMPPVFRIQAQRAHQALVADGHVPAVRLGAHALTRHGPEIPGLGRRAACRGNHCPGQGMLGLGLHRCGQAHQTVPVDPRAGRRPDLGQHGLANGQGSGLVKDQGIQLPSPLQGPSGLDEHAQLRAAPRADDAEDRSHMRAVVIYESLTGNTKKAAGLLAE